MEIINLLLFFGVFYFLYSIGLFLKLVLFFTTCILTSILSNDENLNTLKKYDEKYKISSLFFGNFKIIYEYTNTNSTWLMKQPYISNIYDYLVFLNNHFVKGRNILLFKAGDKMLKVNPQIAESKNISDINVTKSNKVFKNKEEMILFLDELLEKNK